MFEFSTTVLVMWQLDKLASVFRSWRRNGRESTGEHCNLIRDISPHLGLGHGSRKGRTSHLHMRAEGRAGRSRSRHLAQPVAG